MASNNTRSPLRRNNKIPPITISSPKLDSTENHPYLARNSGALFITASVVVPKKTC